MKKQQACAPQQDLYHDSAVWMWTFKLQELSWSQQNVKRTLEVDHMRADAKLSEGGCSFSCAHPLAGALDLATQLSRALIVKA